ncbi:cation-translocating P-type ATPase [Chlorobium sp. N1]|uniref:cation-translocating P-type ATPase n=1 Tax=Chlorobium sp. N1 TaxID=2491138 RepID=UPI00103FC579|nr:cation-translocating P-type ATPase [Chlorobium sp. N1]TCD48427.1 cation-translocating P-type ATPase [Chlorobium sp. N1]
MESDSAERWHAQPSGEVLRGLEASLEGLSSEEARRRFHRDGPNRIGEPRRISPIKLFLRQFANVLILILLLAALLSLWLGELLESAAILVIVLFAVILGFVQEYRAERSVAALQRMASPSARVRRGGREMEVDATEIVRGDILILGAGDRVAADGRLLRSSALLTDESALTGESESAEKTDEGLFPPEAVPADRLNMVFAGTAVRAGRAEAVVTAVGMQTEFGRIASMLGEVAAEPTPLQKSLDRMGGTLARSAVVIVLFIVLSGLWQGRPFLEMLLFGVALAVAVVPEALPAVVTISLALGVQQMARRNALMRSLPAVETLGSTTVICTDKTGTLTRDEMTVRRILLPGGELELGGTGYAPEGALSSSGGGAIPSGLEEFLAAGVLCNDAALEQGGEGEWRVRGDPTEGALLVAARKGGIEEEELRRRHPRLDEVPFSSQLRRMLTLHRFGEGARACMKGAPEAVLGRCSSILVDGEVRALGEDGTQELLAAAGRYAAGAMRVLALAWRDADGLDGADGGMTFLGLAAMIDPPRPEAGAAVRRCMEAGMRPVMITGDHPETASAIARELGFPGAGRVVSGAMLEEMDEGAFREAAGSVSVFARVSPEHKLRLVGALQEQGEIVAMTGDGVNDAPALKRADIGISMGIAGTDVAREASAMTLLDDNFASIIDAVEEGRGIYDNIKKYLAYLLSSNIGELGLMAAATLIGLPVPLTAVQILYVNLATDGLPALALGVDPHDEELMRRPPADPSKGVFTPPLLVLMLAGGLCSALCNLLLFVWALSTSRPVEAAMTMTFVSLVAIEFVKAYAFRSLSGSLLRRPFANRWLNLSVVSESLLLLLVLQLPLLREMFGLASLDAAGWAASLLPALTVLPVLELVKFFIRRREGGSGPGGGIHTKKH